MAQADATHGVPVSGTERACPSRGSEGGRRCFPAAGWVRTRSARLPSSEPVAICSFPLRRRRARGRLSGARLALPTARPLTALSHGQPHGRALSLGVAWPRHGADVQPSSRAVRVAAGPPVWGVRCVTQRGMPWPPEEPQAGSHVGCCSRYEMKGHTVTPPTPQDLTSSINRVPGPG